MRHKLFPISFPINSEEELHIIHCALSEFNDADADTQRIARITELRLEILVSFARQQELAQ